MIVPVLLVGGATFRRLLGLRHLALAALGGALVGVVVHGLPAPGLAVEAYHVLVAAACALLVLPLVAALPTTDRAGGYEQLQALRPMGSLAWTLGRVLGCLVAASLLALLVGSVASAIAGRREVPRLIVGLAEGETGAHLSRWRFALPKGEAGPYDLTLDTFLPLAGSGALQVELQRGHGRQELLLTVLPMRRQVVSLPDLSPERGDLYVTLRAADGLVLGRDAPRLAVGVETLADGDALALRRSMLLHLAFATLVVLATACAFHFETACLAGLLALVAQRPVDGATAAGVTGLVLLLAVLGVALVRRQVLP